MRTGPSVRIFTDLQDRHALSRHHVVPGAAVERHFPLHTGLRAMREWQHDTKARLRQKNSRRVSFGGPAGALSAAVKLYSSQTTAMAS